MNVLVVGAGSMGANHVRVYAEALGVERVVVAEPFEEARKKLQARGLHNVVIYPSVKDALAKEDIAAASVVVPTAHHYSAASELVSKGIPTLVEKPICDNLADAKKLVKEAQKANVLLMVGHIERFNPAVLALKKHLHLLGDVFYASARRFGVPTPRDVGEAFFDQAVHDIDVISFLVSKYPTKVNAVESQILDKRYRDLCAALYEFDNFRATVEANRVTPIKRRELIVLGTKGEAHLDYINQDLVLTTAEHAAIKYSSFDELVLRVGRGTELKPYFVKEEPLKVELQHFLNAAQGKEKPLVTGEDGLRALAATLVGIKAAKTGKREPIEV